MTRHHIYHQRITILRSHGISHHWCWLVVWNMNFIFHFMYGIDNPSHWQTPSFFKMVKLHHQPDNLPRSTYNYPIIIPIKPHKTRGFHLFSPYFFRDANGPRVDPVHRGLRWTEWPRWVLRPRWRPRRSCRWRVAHVVVEFHPMNR